MSLKAGILFGHACPTERTTKNRILGFICLQRPALAAMGATNALAGAVLALRGLPSMFHLAVGLTAVYLLVSAMHTTNDLIDRERDKRKWPARPLPTGVVRVDEAIAYTLMLGALSITLAYYFFTWQSAVICLITWVSGAFYTAFTRDKIGYLTLPWITSSFIALGGWAAFRPETLFSLPAIILYFLFVDWQTFHILTDPYALLYTKTFIIKCKPKTTAYLSVFFSTVCLAIGLMLYYYAGLHWMFLVMLGLASLLFWKSVAPMVEDPTSPPKAVKAFQAAVIYQLILCIAIVVSAAV